MDRELWRQLRRRQVEERMDTLWAPIYDENWGASISPTHLHVIETFLDRCRPGGHILDAACGTGEYSPTIRASGRSVFGIDQSAGMLAQAARKHPTVATRKLGVQELVDEAAFDGICCIDVMESVYPEDWALALANFSRALRPRSPLYVTVEIPDAAELAAVNAEAKRQGLPAVDGEYVKDEFYHYYPAIEQVTCWLAKAGFDVQDHTVGDEYHHLIAWKDEFCLLHPGFLYTIILHSTQREAGGVMTEEYTTVPELAARLRVSEETIRRWLRSGKLPSVRLGDRGRAGYRIRVVDANAFLAAMAARSAMTVITQVGAIVDLAGCVLCAPSYRLSSNAPPQWVVFATRETAKNPNSDEILPLASANTREEADAIRSRLIRDVRRGEKPVDLRDTASVSHS